MDKKPILKIVTARLLKPQYILLYTEPAYNFTLSNEDKICINPYTCIVFSKDIKIINVDSYFTPEITWDNLHNNKSNVNLAHYHLVKISPTMDITDEVFIKTIFQKNSVLIDTYEILKDEIYYDQGEFGAIYSNENTIFRFFAPRAKQVYLYIKKCLTTMTKKYPMHMKENGVWSLKIKGDILNYLYQYQVKRPGMKLDQLTEVNRIQDPYGKQVVFTFPKNQYFAYTKVVAPLYEDKTQENVSIERPVLSEKIIYELHVRDFSIHETGGIPQELKGSLFALGESAEYEGCKTGFDHIKELGVNCVQILPLHHFERYWQKKEYNWGYMPINYFSLENWYARSGYEEKLREDFRNIVRRFHSSGISVIMDVVYNHTAILSPLYTIDSRYYFRWYRDKEINYLMNDSGCGNTIQSERVMCRKMIIDSMHYFVREFDIDGFRFDLFALVDMETIEIICHDPVLKNKMIYGEPWSASGFVQWHKGDQKALDFAVFNDDFRNTIAGSPDASNKGFIQGNFRFDALKEVITGSKNYFTSSPNQSINYVACHDNYTLADRLAFQNFDGSSGTNIKQNHIAAVLLFSSLGTSFIHAGQEMLRSKKGDHNSYRSDDSINAIDWSWKKKNSQTFLYYKNLINMRKNHPGLRRTNFSDVKENYQFFMGSNEKSLGYIINKGNTKDENDFLFLLNPVDTAASFDIPEGNWEQIADENQFDWDGMGVLKKKIQLNAQSLVIAVRT